MDKEEGTMNQRILGLTSRQFLKGIFVGNLIGLAIQIGVIIYISVR